MTNLRLINLENQILTLRNQNQNNLQSQIPVHMVPPQPIFHATQTIAPNQWTQQAQPFFHHSVPAPPPYMYRQSDKIPEASRQVQRPNINQQVQQAQMFNPLPSELVTQLPTSDSNNCIAVDQTSSQQFLFNQSYRNQGKGNRYVTDSGHDAYRAALDTLKEIILKYQHTHSIMIAGDFNASFIRHYKDPQDELFKQFCKENGLELPAKYPTDHTYFQGTSRSQIDYILAKFVESNLRFQDLIQVEILGTRRPQHL
ncbi:unnamed protein product [Mytilus edulis]|uniref:Endonuclease/exonuclease/phosphatase domain-containing protein n=1 Tax=Mytilus edulis TaxID=6550 RepID=A0A8S3U8I9_MYTED|nr:unnamed protein product [Mytilus edulis]